MQMKKERLRLLLACGLLMSPIANTITAQSRMVVTTNGGSTFEFFVYDNPKMTYYGNVLSIANDLGASMTVEAADVKTFKFYPSYDTETGISHTATGTRGRLASMMSGLEPGTAVEVHTLGALKVQTVTVGTEGTAEIDFGSLPEGIYVVKTGKGTFKVANKK